MRIQGRDVQRSWSPGGMFPTLWFCSVGLPFVLAGIPSGKHAWDLTNKHLLLEPNEGRVRPEPRQGRGEHFDVEGADQGRAVGLPPSQCVCVFQFAALFTR